MLCVIVLLASDNMMFQQRPVQEQVFVSSSPQEVGAPPLLKTTLNNLEWLRPLLTAMYNIICTSIEFVVNAINELK